jgi:hypothetical protein
MPIATLALAFVALAQTAPTSQFKVPEGGGIVYGDELGVGVGAPAGWIFDAESGVSQGLHAVMYPQGSSWARATSVMYINVVKVGPKEALSDFIAGDVETFKGRFQDLRVEVGESIKLLGGPEAEVRHYSGDAWGNREAVAYAMQGGSVAIFVLSCRSAADFTASLPAFQQMVAKSFLVAMKFSK